MAPQIIRHYGPHASHVCILSDHANGRRTLFELACLTAQLQELTRAENPPKDHSKDWIIPVTVTRSNESAKKVAEIVNTALKNLDSSLEGMNITEEDVADITAEWQGVKSEKSLQRERPVHRVLIVVDLNGKSEREKYELLCEDSESEMVVLYFHGGGFMWNSL